MARPSQCTNMMIACCAQAAAVPANLSDPDLVDWTKVEDNPLTIDIPPGGTHAQFRDPVTAWVVARPGGSLLPTPPSPSSSQLPLNRTNGTLSKPGARGMLQFGGSSGNSTSDLAAASPAAVSGHLGGGPNASSSPAGEATERGNGSELLGGAAGDQQVVWFTAVGVQDDCVGAAALYQSTDMLR